MMNLHDHEKMKSYPARYPLNQDSIGIELIGKFDKNKGEFESVTPAQNASLQWLIKALLEVMNLKTIDVFRHPEISGKQGTEAKTANWQSVKDANR